MKNVIISAIVWLFAISPTVRASLIWSEDFSSYSAGDSIDGQATSFGGGTFSTVDGTGGSVRVNAAGGVDLTAGSTRAQLAIISTADVQVGRFSFDVVANDDADAAFLQFVDGPDRSTSGTPQPNLSDGVNYPTTTSQTINYFFNVSGTAAQYTAPDSTTRTLANNTYDFWFGTSPTLGQSNSNNGGGFPSGVDSIFFQTFSGQEGSILSFDNFALASIAVPEPSSALMMVVLFGAMVFSIRGRRTLASA